MQTRDDPGAVAADLNGDKPVASFTEAEHARFLAYLEYFVVKRIDEREQRIREQRERFARSQRLAILGDWRDGLGKRGVRFE